MARTVEYYEENADELSRRYESAALDSLHRLLNETFRPDTKLLEIGCGSGRDAARLTAAGYDVIATDGSQNLLREAKKLHPELADRLLHVRLPATLPFADHSIGGFFSIACLMHFCDTELAAILSELARVTRKSGKGVVSVPAGRNDIDGDCLDQHGRHFNIMPAEAWQTFFNHHGFSSEAGPPEPDSLGREGISWVTFILTRF